MENIEQKPLRQEILKVEVDLRHVTDPEKFLQLLQETLKQFGIDNHSLEIIPIFFPGKKWYIPETTFVSLSVSKDVCTKLSQWERNEDSLNVHTSDGELLIINETKLDEWRLEQQQQNEGCEHCVRNPKATKPLVKMHRHRISIENWEEIERVAKAESKNPDCYVCQLVQKCLSAANQKYKD